MADFIIKSITKAELAMLYFPDTGTTHTAENHFIQWFKNDPELVRGLEAPGYRETTKTFTPKQVEVIVTRLGKPEEYMSAKPK